MSVERMIMIQQLTQNDYYRTTDLALAATLSLRYPIEFIERGNPQKASFVFLRNEGLDKVVEMYWRREMQVEPQAYFDQLKLIKARIYSES